MNADVHALAGAYALNALPASERGGGSMTLISSADQGRVVVLAESLPDPGPGEVYQLWLLDEEGAEPTQAFFTGSGRGQVHLMEDMPADAQVAVTREPDGGSQTPSMDPLGVVSAVAT